MPKVGGSLSGVDVDKNDDGRVRGFPIGAHPHLPGTPVPVGQSCFDCKEPIQSDDVGITLLHHAEKTERVPAHQACFAKILGLPAIARGAPRRPH